MEATEPSKWLSDLSTIDAHLSQYDLPSLLNNGDGLIKISKFLPPAVADHLLNLTKGLSEHQWSLRKDKDVNIENRTAHEFYVANSDLTQEQLVDNAKVGCDNVAQMTRILHRLLPEKRGHFSIAKYCSGGMISEHDDHATVEHSLGASSASVLCSRDVAVIYYLTKDWKRSDGGVLVDLQTGKEYVPEFNSLIAFLVPRMHKVTTVSPSSLRDPRYSVFGWFLSEGNLYKYIKDPKETSNPQKRKRKRRRKK